MNEFNVIFEDENIIGFTTDIIKYLKYEIENMKELLGSDMEEDTYIEQALEGIELLEETDGYLVRLNYNPMGAYYVQELYDRDGEMM